VLHYFLFLKIQKNCGLNCLFKQFKPQRYTFYLATYTNKVGISQIDQFKQKCLTNQLRVAKQLTYNNSIVNGRKIAFFLILPNFLDSATTAKKCAKNVQYQTILNKKLGLIITLSNFFRTFAVAYAKT
jgi:hypothetical protein